MRPAKSLTAASKIAAQILLIKTILRFARPGWRAVCVCVRRSHNRSGPKRWTFLSLLSLRSGKTSRTTSWGAFSVCYLTDLVVLNHKSRKEGWQNDSARKHGQKRLVTVSFFRLSIEKTRTRTEMNKQTNH